eukprot:scaffold5834_cov376-Prasinococcus_capsulatus_cf.AAC.7
MAKAMHWRHRQVILASVNDRWRRRLSRQNASVEKLRQRALRWAQGFAAATEQIVQRLETDIIALKDVAQAKAVHYTRVDGELKFAQAQADHVRESLELQSAHASEARSQAEKLYEDLRERMEESAALQVEAAQVRGQLKKCEAHNTSLQQSLDAKCSELGVASEELRVLGQSHAALKTEFYKLTEESSKSIAQLVSQCNTLKKDIVIANSLAEHRLEKIQSLHGEARKLEGSITCATDQTRQALALAEESTGSMNKLAADVKHLSRSLQTATGACEDLQARYRASQDSQANLQMALKHCLGSREELQAAYVRDRNRWHEEQHGLQEQVKRLASQLLANRGAAQRYEQQLNAANNLVQDSTFKVEQLKKHVSRLQMQRKSADAHLADACNEISRLKARLAETEESHQLETGLIERDFAIKLDERGEEAKLALARLNAALEKNRASEAVIERLEERCTCIQAKNDQLVDGMVAEKEALQIASREHEEAVSRLQKEHAAELDRLEKTLVETQKETLDSVRDAHSKAISQLKLSFENEKSELAKACGERESILRENLARLQAQARFAEDAHMEHLRALSKTFDETSVLYRQTMEHMEQTVGNATEQVKDIQQEQRDQLRQLVQRCSCLSHGLIMALQQAAANECNLQAEKELQRKEQQDRLAELREQRDELVRLNAAAVSKFVNERKALAQTHKEEVAQLVREHELTIADVSSKDEAMMEELRTSALAAEKEVGELEAKVEALEAQLLNAKELVQESEHRASWVLLDSRKKAAESQEKQGELHRRLLQLEEHQRNSEVAFANEKAGLQNEIDRLTRLGESSCMSLKQEIENVTRAASEQADLAQVHSSAAAAAQRNEQSARALVQELQAQVDAFPNEWKQLTVRHERDMSEKNAAIAAVQMQLERAEAELREARSEVEQAHSARDSSFSEQSKLSELVLQLREELGRSKLATAQAQESMHAHEELGRRLLQSDADLRKELDSMRECLSIANDQEQEMAQVIHTLGEEKRMAELDATKARSDLETIKRVLELPRGSALLASDNSPNEVASTEQDKVPITKEHRQGYAIMMDKDAIQGDSLQQEALTEESETKSIDALVLKDKHGSSIGDLDRANEEKQVADCLAESLKTTEAARGDHAKLSRKDQELLTVSTQETKIRFSSQGLQASNSDSIESPGTLAARSSEVDCHTLAPLDIHTSDRDHVQKVKTVELLTAQLAQKHEMEEELRETVTEAAMTFREQANTLVGLSGKEFHLGQKNLYHQGQLLYKKHMTYSKAMMDVKAAQVSLDVAQAKLHQSKGAESTFFTEGEVLAVVEETAHMTHHGCLEDMREVLGEIYWRRIQEVGLTATLESVLVVAKRLAANVTRLTNKLEKREDEEHVSALERWNLISLMKEMQSPCKDLRLKVHVVMDTVTGGRIGSNFCGMGMEAKQPSTWSPGGKKTLPKRQSLVETMIPKFRGSRRLSRKVRGSIGDAVSPISPPTLLQEAVRNFSEETDKPPAAIAEDETELMHDVGLWTGSSGERRLHLNPLALGSPPISPPVGVATTRCVARATPAKSAWETPPPDGGQDSTFVTVTARS